MGIVSAIGNNIERAISERLDNLWERTAVGRSAGEKPKLKQIFVKYLDVLSNHSEDLGKTGLVEHSTPLVPNANSVKHVTRRLGPEKKVDVEKQLAKLQQHGPNRSRR